MITGIIGQQRKHVFLTVRVLTKFRLYIQAVLSYQVQGCHMCCSFFVLLCANKRVHNCCCSSCFQQLFTLIISRISSVVMDLL